MKPKDYRQASAERAAREKGRSISHYSRKVSKELVSPPKRGKVTPSKRA